MSSRQTPVIALSVVIAAVAATGVGTALTASAAPTRPAATANPKLGQVFAHRVGKDPARVSVKIPKTHQVTVAPLSVPAGSYLVTFTAHFNAGAETNALFYCSIGFHGKRTTYGRGLEAEVGAASGVATASEQETITFPSAGKIEPYCGRSAGDTGNTAGIANAELTALVVSKVHSTG